MRILKNLYRMLSFITGIFLATLTLGSCSNGSSGNDDAPETQRAVYTSTDSDNGYFNINNGQYRTCTLEGTETEGTITFSDGIAEDLTGTFKSANSSRAAFNWNGVFTITFKLEILKNRTWTVTISKDIDTLSIKGTSSDGRECSIFCGHKLESNIIPGTEQDPVNGTEWKLNEYWHFKFENGRYTEGSSNSSKPYSITKTGNAYNIILSYSTIANTNIANSGLSYTLDTYYILRLKDKDSIEAEYLGMAVSQYSIDTPLNRTTEASFGIYYKQ